MIWQLTLDLCDTAHTTVSQLSMENSMESYGTN